MKGTANTELHDIENMLRIRASIVLMIFIKDVSSTPLGLVRLQNKKNHINSCKVAFVNNCMHHKYLMGIHSKKYLVMSMDIHTLWMSFSNASVPFSSMYFSAAVRTSSGLLKTSFFLGTYQMLIVCGLRKNGLT